MDIDERLKEFEKTVSGIVEGTDLIVDVNRRCSQPLVAEASFRYRTSAAIDLIRENPSNKSKVKERITASLNELKTLVTQQIERLERE